VNAVSLRTLLLLAAAASAIGCEAIQRSDRNGGSGIATAPSSLKREVDDLPGTESSTSGTPTTTTGCDTPPCQPSPDPTPQPVNGRLVVSAADGSTIQDDYITTTTPSGTPVLGMVGNADATFASGTGRFAGVRNALFSVEFSGGSTAELALKWSIFDPEEPDGFRSYGDSATLPYASQKVADSNCPSGHRFTATLSGRMEHLGRFTATLNHCVSPLQ
jgi:hypothetical protein